MTGYSASPYLTDIVDAIERVRSLLGDMPLETFTADWEKQWAIERGVEIISEASRRLPAETKARHPEIPWPKVAGIGKRTAPRLRKHLRAGHVETGAGDLPELDLVCRAELAMAITREKES